MDDKEYFELKEKIRVEEERRANALVSQLKKQKELSLLDSKIKNFETRFKSAFEEVGALNYVTSTKVVITHSVDNNGYGTAGSHNYDYIIEFDKDEIKEMLKSYLIKLKKEYIELLKEE